MPCPIVDGVSGFKSRRSVYAQYSCSWAEHPEGVEQILVNMKFGFSSKSSPVAAQVLQVSVTGVVCGRAFVQSNGSLGAYSDEQEDFPYEGEVFETEAEALAAAQGFPPSLVPAWWEPGSFETLLQEFGTTGIYSLKIHSLWANPQEGKLLLQAGKYIVGEAIVFPPANMDYEGIAPSIKFRAIDPESPQGKKVAFLCHPDSKISSEDRTEWVTEGLDTLYPVHLETLHWDRLLPVRKSKLARILLANPTYKKWENGASGLVGYIDSEGRKIRV